MWYYIRGLGQLDGGCHTIEVQLQKQPRKYLDSVDKKTRAKLIKALDGLAELNGDIARIEGYDNFYRLKISHYRFLFSVDFDQSIIMVKTINTRTNIKY